MRYLNDVSSLVIGVCIEEALGLAHRAQQKHRSLSTSRTIQQQLQRSLILAGKLRGETKNRPNFSQVNGRQVEALITLRRLRIDVPRYRATKKRFYVYFANDLRNLFEARVF